MDPDQTAPMEQSDLDLQGLNNLQEASKTFRQTTNSDNFVAIGALRVI